MSVYNALTWQNVTGPKDGTQAAITASALANDTINKALTGFSKSLGSFQHSMEDRATGAILGNVMEQGTGKAALDAIKNGSIYGDINKNYINTDARAKALGAVSNMLKNDENQYRLDELLPLEAEAKRVSMQEARSRMASAAINDALNRQKLSDAQNQRAFIEALSSASTPEERNKVLSGGGLVNLKHAANQGYIDEATFKAYSSPTIPIGSTSADGTAIAGTGIATSPEEILANVLIPKHDELVSNAKTAKNEADLADETVINAVLSSPKEQRRYVDGADELKDLTTNIGLSKVLPELPNTVVSGSPVGFANLGSVGELSNQAKNFINNAVGEDQTIEDVVNLARQKVLGNDFKDILIGTDPKERKPYTPQNHFTDPFGINRHKEIFGMTDNEEYKNKKELKSKLENPIDKRKEANTKLGEAQRALEEFSKDPIKTMDIMEPNSFKSDPLSSLSTVQSGLDNSKKLVDTIGYSNDQYLIDGEYAKDKRSIPELIINHEGLKGLDKGDQEDIAKNLKDLTEALNLPPRVALEMMAKVTGTYHQTDSISNSQLDRIKKLAEDYKNPQARERALNRNQAIKDYQNKIATIEANMAAVDTSYRIYRQRPDLLERDPNALDMLSNEMYKYYVQLYKMQEDLHKLYSEVNGTSK